MSEENKNRCPKCDKGKLRILQFRATESDGRNWHSIDARICQLCDAIFTSSDKITFHKMATSFGSQSA